MEARPDLELEKRTFAKVMLFMEEKSIEYNSVQRFSANKNTKHDPIEVGALSEAKLELDEEGYMTLNGVRM